MMPYDAVNPEPESVVDFFDPSGSSVSAFTDAMITEMEAEVKANEGEQKPQSSFEDMDRMISLLAAMEAKITYLVAAAEAQQGVNQYLSQNVNWIVQAFTSIQKMASNMGGPFGKMAGRMMGNG